MPPVKNQSTVRRLPLEPDDIAPKSEENGACDLVPISGYFGKGPSDEERHLYKDRSLRRWITIPTEAIVDRTATEDDLRQGKSMLWVKRDATVIDCEAVPASSYDQPPAVNQPREEDLAYRYPR